MFQNKTAYVQKDSMKANKQLDNPIFSANLAIKCPQCKNILYGKDWQRNLKICTICDYHFRLTAYERIDLLTDVGSFVEIDKECSSPDPLNFVARTQPYAQKLAQERQKHVLCDAVVTGHALIETHPLVLAVMDFHFIGGSMGSVVGEKITRAIEFGITRRFPVLIVAASGGARMQEGIYSLMQMAKTTAALVRLGEERLPYFSLLTDPTTGGVTASYAMLGDVTLAEPGSLVCFAGPRVIEQFMHVSLPEGAISAEFALQHGHIDSIIHRKQLRSTLARLLHLFQQSRSS